MVNKVILIGNVGADPEIRTFEDGSKVARINLATTERIFNPKTQERTDHTEWHNLVVWRGLATLAEQYIRKGSQLYVEGKIRKNEWTDTNGQKRTGVDISVDNLNILGRREQSQGQYQQQGQAPIYGGGQSQPVQQRAPQGMTNTPQAAPTNFEQMPSPDDDLPF